MTLTEANKRLSEMLPVDETYKIDMELWRHGRADGTGKPEITWSIYVDKHFNGLTLEEAFLNFEADYRNKKALEGVPATIDQTEQALEQQPTFGVGIDEKQ